MRTIQLKISLSEEQYKLLESKSERYFSVQDYMRAILGSRPLKSEALWEIISYKQGTEFSIRHTRVCELSQGDAVLLGNYLKERRIAHKEGKMWVRD